MEPKLLSKNWTKLSHEILEDERIPGKYRLQISALYGIIYNGSKSYGYCSFTQEYLGNKIFVERKHIGKLLSIMSELCYIHIESKLFDNTGLTKTQTRITILDKKIMKKKKETTSVARAEDVRRTDEERTQHGRIKRVIKENNKETIDNTFLNSVEENSKTKKKYSTSTREKALAIDKSLDDTNEKVIFGKGFNKYSEDLYEL